MIGVTPKFSYNAGSGVVDFVPTNPPVNKTPFAPLEAVRHDSITSNGTKQSVWERTDVFVVLDFQNVPEADLANWQAFLSWALQGNEFTYYPDQADPSTFAEYLLEDMGWAPKRTSFKNYAFQIRMRLGVGLGQHFS